MKLNAVGLIHKVLEAAVPNGGFCIDATAGKGRDTAFLCKIVGEDGRVLAFDIQQEAVFQTKEHLAAQGLQERAEVVLDSHEHMEQYAAPESVDGIVFNFGWLPGGDHRIFTRPDSSIRAIAAGLRILKPGGIMALCIYAGKDTGFEERDRLLEFLETVDDKKYTVISAGFCNRPNHPPLPVFLVKHKE